MNQKIQFCINRIAASTQPFRPFAAMAQRLGVDCIEIRNDLKGVELSDGTPASEISAVAAAHGLTIRSINALQRFEQYDAEREAEARALAAYAQACGAQALVLCPTNDRQDPRNAEQRHTDLVQALRQLRPLLNDHGLVGLIESLGFAECAVRRKSQAVQAILETEQHLAGRCFELVHDTFHHHLAGETQMFPERTGLVHISGVENDSLQVSEMRDEHRVLVGPKDRLGNLAQLREMLAQGYSGYLSFEPFAEDIIRAPDIETRLGASMAYLREALAGAASSSSVR